jgi:hypothetical protein
MRRLAIAVSMVVPLILLAGCGGGSHAARRSPPTTLRRSPTTTATQPPTTATIPLADVPTLGQLTGTFFNGKGFGQVKPSIVFNGGDPTGYVGDVVWQSWGGSTAIGAGMSDYVGPNQTVSQGTQESVTIVAFNLGTCDGKLMYQAVEWYFPQHGMTFDPNQYEDICTGSYFPPTS